MVRSGQAQVVYLFIFFLVQPLFQQETRSVYALSPTAVKIISHLAAQQVSWKKNMLPPPLSNVAEQRFKEQVVVGASETLSDVALSAKSYASTQEGAWSAGFHFWHAPKGILHVSPTTGSCSSSKLDKNNPCIWKATLNYTSKLFDQYGSSSAGASGKVANTGIPDTSSLGLVVDLYSDLHSPVRLGPSSRYGEHVRVRNVRLNKSLPEIIETSEFGLWEEDPFLLELIRWKGYENWTTYADALLRDKRLSDPVLRTLTNIDFGQIGCFNIKLVTSMFATWANESAALLRAESCLSDNKMEKGCSQDFFQNLANSLELRLLTCSLRVANSMDLLFITPPDNVISPLCKKNVPFSIDNNILAISVTIIFVLAAMLFFCVFLPKIKRAQESTERPYSTDPDSPLTDTSIISNNSRRHQNYESFS